MWSQRVTEGVSVGCCWLVRVCHFCCPGLRWQRPELPWGQTERVGGNEPGSVMVLTSLPILVFILNMNNSLPAILVAFLRLIIESVLVL